MKNQEDIRSSIIKGAAVLLVALSLLPFGEAKAQTVQSAQYKFVSRYGGDVIVRENSSGMPVIGYRRGSLDVGTGFVYGDMYTNAIKEFIITDTITATGTVSYRINDVCVVGDMCYFCGVRRFIYTEPDPVSGAELGDSVGILGRFYLDPAGFGSSVKYNIRYVSQTKSLDRMVAYFSNNDTVLAMIGVVNNSTSESCLMVARRRVTFLEQWKYIVRCASTTEVFTDIAVDAGIITISSYQRSTNGKYHFNLRKAVKLEMFSSTSLSSKFDSLYTYDLDNTCAKLIRPDNTDVLLSAVPWNMKTYAAFACSMNFCEDSPCQTAMCEIETENMVMNIIQIVQKMYSSPHTLKDTKYLYKSSGDESSASVALLHLTDDSYKTVVEYPYALPSSYTGTVPRALVQQLENNVMRSISSYGGNDVRFGGQWGFPTTSIPTYLQEILPSIGDGDMCMQNNESEVLIIDHAEMPVRDNVSLADKTESLVDLVWGTKVVYPKVINVDNTCIYQP